MYCSHRGLKIAFFVSLAIHLVLILTIPAHLERQKKELLPVYQVSLVEPEAPKPVVKPKPAPPKPKPVVKKTVKPKPKPEVKKPVKPKPKPVKKTEPPKKKAVVPPKPKIEPKKSTVTQKTKPKPVKTPPAPPKPEPVPPEPPKPAPAKPQPKLEIDPALPAWYYETVRDTVWRNWQEPSGVMVGSDGIRVVIGFDILRSGKTTKPRIIESSGDSRLDLSALRAVFDSNPFPPLPAEFKEEQLGVRFSFVYGKE